MKRIFLAIKIIPEPELLDVFSEIKSEFENEKIKWVNEDQFHITLRFFGDTDDETIKSIIESLDKEVSSVNSFPIGIAKPSYFKGKRQLKAILLGIGESNFLNSLHEQIENKLQDLGIEKENRKFRAHLTLGRVKFIKDSRRFYEFIKSFNDELIQKVLVEEIVLFESILKQTGPEYLVIKKFKLKE